RGVSQEYLPDYAKVFQFQRNHRNLTAFERSMFILNSTLQNVKDFIATLMKLFYSLFFHHKGLSLVSDI
ncbi:MAG: hypothetical protein K6U11_12540, partial [bacterium]|nr:hypothetical protein [bacterium]